MRDAMCADDHDPAGLYFGGRNGAVWCSPDEGRTWQEIHKDLPDVMVVRPAALEETHAMANFEMSRATTINAPADRVLSLLNDFREWPLWSPWEGLDPDLKRTFTGPATGVGSHYAWAGNKQAGEGTMEITESTSSSVAIDLKFLKPFKASNITAFDLTEAGSGTTGVNWTMTGTRSLIMGLMGKLFFDKAIVKDFDKGLAQLKAAAESR